MERIIATGDYVSFKTGLVVDDEGNATMLERGAVGEYLSTQQLADVLFADVQLPDGRVAMVNLADINGVQRGRRASLPARG
jgi:hypothetical protein